MQPFGTVFVDHMTQARWSHGVWDEPKLGPLQPIQLHPAAHALHYGSSCFEGLKAHRGDDGVVRVFRLDHHIERFRRSAETLVLPAPPVELITRMVLDLVRAAAAEVPDAPGSLYIRPVLLGCEPNVGAASRPTQDAILYVIASPVGDYFSGGLRPLKLAVETETPRTTPQFGMVKTGANYAMALGLTLRATEAFGVDQVLFAPGGRVQETGASNFLLVDDERLITPQRTSELLSGVTLDSLLRLGGELGYAVEERPLTVDEVQQWAERPVAEAALSGTAAVLSGVGTLIIAGKERPVGIGSVGPNTARLREALTDLHAGRRPDRYGWLTAI